MKLVILDDYDKASEWAAKYVRNSILKFNPGPDKYYVLGLPTGKINESDFANLADTFSLPRTCSLLTSGGTPLGMYRKLVEFHKQDKLSFKYVKTFNMDEYVGMIAMFC